MSGSRWTSFVADPVTTATTAPVPAETAAAPRPWTRSRQWVAWVCAVVALAVGVLVAATAVGPRGDVSTLVHIASTDRIATLVRRENPTFRFVPANAHYDGTYYYAIARDPLALGSHHLTIDLAAKRYGHAFYGQLAWVLSFGNAAWVPIALLLISLIALFVAAFCASQLAAGFGWSPWAGLVVALSPGLLYATTVDTSETVGAALLGLSLLAWQRRRTGLAAVAFVGLALTKEPLSLVPLGVFLYELVRIRRRDGRFPRPAWLRDRSRLGKLLALAAGPVVLFGWLQYVRTRFDAFPLTGNADAGTAPSTGILDTLRQAGRFGVSDFGHMQVGAVAIPLVVLLLATMSIGIVVALRLRTLLDGAFLATAPLMYILTPSNVLFPKDFLRLTAIPLLLLPAVLFGGRQRAVSDEGRGSSKASHSRSMRSPTPR